MKEEEIRPKEIFAEYLSLCEKEASGFDRQKFIEIQCPGCGERDVTELFQKNFFSYKKCRICNSLFCSPRPSEKILTDFYRESEASRYWATVFFPVVAEARREKMFRKKALRLANYLDERSIAPQKICDVGAGYGVFLEELRALLKSGEFSAVEPSPDLAAVCRQKGFETLERFVEDAGEWYDRFDLVICSEVLEHVFSTDKFLRSLFALARPGGYVLVTGLGYEGYDILTLQKDSKSVSPPHHLNFLSVRGCEDLFRRTGFRSVEVFTPGELDFDIVINSPAPPEFARALAARGEEAIQAFQIFLQKYRLSSHVWVLAQK